MSISLPLLPSPPPVTDFLSRHSLDQDAHSPAPKRRKDSMCVINDSEESQLAAAIAASIQDSSAACPKDPILILSDSDEDSDIDDSESQAMDESDSTGDHLTSQHLTDKHHCASLEAVVTPFLPCTARTGVGEPLGRQDSGRDGVKALRNELQTLKVEEKHLFHRQMDKRGAANPAKGKSRAGRGQPCSGEDKTKAIDVDGEATGEVSSSDARVTCTPAQIGTSKVDGLMEGVDLSQLLLRLPDGSRVEKSFPADRPIEVCCHSHHPQDEICSLNLLLLYCLLKLHIRRWSGGYFERIM